MTAQLRHAMVRAKELNLESPLPVLCALLELQTLFAPSHRAEDAQAELKTLETFSMGGQMPKHGRLHTDSIGGCLSTYRVVLSRIRPL